MNIIELLFLLGIIVAIWNLPFESKRPTKKFGDGLLSDVDTNNFPKNHIP